MILDMLFTVALMLISFLAQTVLLPALGVTSLAPHLVLASVVCVALLCGSYAGMTAGVLAGCALDVFFCPAIGMTAIPLAAIGFLAGVKSSRFHKENLIAPAILSVVGVLASDVFSMFLLYFTRSPAVITGAVAFRCFLSALMTGGAALPIYLVCYRVYTRGKRRRDDSQLMMVG
ncbi:MAG: rod shape-determining protein MreD [Clostridiales bacterium]|nr:rod shape-determining protein MreD [Clostridiales bacterium]